MGRICVVTIDGVDYTSAATLTVPIGTVVTCGVGNVSTYVDNYARVSLNGVVVFSISRQGGDDTYDYTVNGNVTINMIVYRDADKDRYGHIDITEL